MNRETESHFAQIPQAEIGRSKFNRGFNHSTTGNVGDIMPLFVDATILPGDTVKMNTGALIRMLTPLTPVMGNMYADVMFFFVPHRLVWKDFKKFMGENNNPWAVTQDIRVPKIKIRGTSAHHEGIEKGSLLNYMGIPIGLGKDVIAGSSAGKEIEISQLPLRSYCKVVNDWFRDQNTQKELYFVDDNTVLATVTKTDALSQEDPYTSNVYKGAICARACRNSDYFSRCLPEPQKGPTPLVPLVGEAPIVYGPSHMVDKTADKYTEIQFDQKVNMRDGTVSDGSPINYYVAGTGTIQDPYRDVQNLDAETWGMYADLEEATGATVQAIRQAFAIQKFYERQARGGSYYIEVVQSHFNVTNPDFRLQRSEYLGGRRFPISINQVVQETPTATQELGFTGAYSVTSDVSEDIFTHSFTEHGTLLGMVIIRYQHSYQQGINAQWFMNGIFDFYWPEFANLGDMPVYNREIYAVDGSAENIAQNNEVFGYQEAWGHYRYMPDLVTGEMSSMYDQSFDIWHWADYYSTLPTLNAEWEREDPSNVTRTLAYQNGDQFKIDMYFDAIYTRPMPLYSVPGLVDHH